MYDIVGGEEMEKLTKNNIIGDEYNIKNVQTFEEKRQGGLLEVIIKKDVTKLKFEQNVLKNLRKLSSIKDVTQEEIIKNQIYKQEDVVKIAKEKK